MTKTCLLGWKGSKKWFQAQEKISAKLVKKCLKNGQKYFSRPEKVPKIILDPEKNDDKICQKMAKVWPKVIFQA